MNYECECVRLVQYTHTRERGKGREILCAHSVQGALFIEIARQSERESEREKARKKERERDIVFFAHRYR